MRKLLFFLIFAACLAPFTGQAQQRRITGSVKAAKDNTTLPGVVVSVKNSNAASSTDQNGNYAISVSGDDVILVFKFIGYQSKEVNVGNSSIINVALTEDVTQLGEVVVTALGIERQKRSLGYATQEVSGRDINTAKEVNVLNSLQGRVAGAQISQSATGVGGSSRVVLRGANSLTGTDNNALIVVDGIPLDNSNNRTPGRFGGIDYGSGVNSVNPEDIASINILKGPNAAALYGERAAAGAIIITTKRGATNGFNISLSSNTTFENPLVYPDFQNEFGQGVGGVHPVDANGQAFIPRNIESSWGPRMNGQPVRDWTGQVKPFSAQPNNVKDFYETGQTYDNILAIDGGNENVQTRFSAGQLINQGILPNSKLNRTTLNLRTSAKITKRLTAEGKINYIYQTSFNRPNLTDNPDNPVYGFLFTPRSINLDDLRTFEDPLGNPVTWAQTGVDPANGFLTSRRQNPFWSVFKNTNEDELNRLNGFLSLKYQFADWLSLQLRSGTDYYNQRIEERTATRTLFESSIDRGKYVITTHTVQETNSDFLFLINKPISEKISFDATAGGNIRYSKREEVGAQTSGLNVPNLFNIRNGAAPVPLYGFAELQTNSIYGTAQFGYQNYLFLDLTARNDWSSTLPQENRSFFYPSASLSFVLTDAVKINSKALSYAKFRASVAEVGGAAQPYQLSLNYNLGLPHLQQGNAAIRNQLPFSDLKPQITRAIEFGTELKFLDNRLGLDLAYYKKNTTNQIFTPPISATSGFTSSLINAGNVQNSGLEVMLTGTPLSSQSGLNWNISANWAYNRSKIVATANGVDNFFIGNDRNVTVAASPGSPFGDFRGRGFQRAANGQVLVGADGLPIRSAVDQVLGNYLPDWTGGISNTFSFKNLRLSFLVDMRKGGDILSLSNVYLAQNGNSKVTLEGRDAWYAGTGGFLVDGVVADANGNLTPNTKFVNPEDYWRKVGAQDAAIAEAFIYDGTFVKLRELTLGYNLPSKLFNKTPFKSANISLVGRNLFLLYSDTPGFDPDVSSYNISNVQGIESAAFPSTRSYGVNLRIGF